MNFRLDKLLSSLTIPVTLVAALGVGCSGGDEEGGPFDAGGPVGDSGVYSRDGGPPAQSLYDKLGGEAAITAVIGDFVGRVVADAKINGYFLNSSVDGTRLTTCLVKQVGSLTGGPQVYPAEGEPADDDGCRNMTESHAGLGISTQDFGDLAGHLVDALAAAGVEQADIDIIVAAVTPLAPAIIEDADDDATIYQRVGRKPAVSMVIGDFVGRVVADAAINGYFLNSSLDAARLGTCLVRQVCALTGGPCKYGEGVEPELDLDGDDVPDPCRDMTTTHAGLGISAADYGDLAGHLVDALAAAGVGQDDIDTIVAALTSPAFVATIVEDPTDNGNIYQRVGRKPAVATVVNDFVGRVVADPAINGYFLNNSVDGARLGTCLIRQVCALTGGPCKYGEGVEPELNAIPCRGMTAVHLNMGISAADYGDLAGHLVDALTAAGVMQADIDTIATALTAPAFVATIVEDPDSNATVYQRVGRKPAIQAVITDFAGRVFADTSINGFFDSSPAAAARLGTCLVRQVCSIDGPCIYGEGVEAALEINGTVVPCRSMIASHTGLTNPRGGGGAAITIADWNALVGHLVDTLTAAAAVAPADRDAIIGALAPLCPDIVAGGTGCP